MQVAAHVSLTSEQRVKLERLLRGRWTEARLVLWAKVVVLAADGFGDLEIAERLGVVPRTAPVGGHAFSRRVSPGWGAMLRGLVARRLSLRRRVLEVIEKTTQQKPLPADPLVDPHHGRCGWHQ